MTDNLHDLSLVGLCLLLMKEGFVTVKAFAGGKKEDEKEYTIQLAIMQLAEGVRNQTKVLEKSIDTQNQLLNEIRREQSEIRKEQFDQKATLTRLEAKL